ncbi:ankyrin [Fusarium albosuccineum]|uniref:Ankyrin n=1 Tax=Fusarium albosuccineum TaxID=1237068 RepID=A0A8H4LH30_9HYPO|nr:ankyrin [Fusarium albosuccineum]
MIHDQKPSTLRLTANHYNSTVNYTIYYPDILHQDMAVDIESQATPGMESSYEERAEYRKNKDIKAVYGLNLQNGDDGTRAELLQKLYNSTFYHAKNRHPEPVEGTYQWFIDHPNFQNWRDDKTSGLLYVTGEPGSGKSVLSRFLADQVLRSISSCYFFFQAEAKEQNTAEAALRCILRQILEQRPQLLSDDISRQFEEDGDKIRCSVRRLWRILVSAAENNRPGPIICILDGLDECQPEGRQQLLTTMNDSFGQIHTGARLKVLITTRTLGHTKPTARFPVLHLGDGDNLVYEGLTSDIDLVVRHRVTELKKIVNLTEAEVQDLRKRIAQNPKPTHLWVFLVFKYLGMCSNKSPDKFTKQNKHLPTTLNGTYDKILSQSSDPAKARKLLHIIVAATRPLTLTEMAVAVAIEDSHSSQSELEIELEDHFRNTLEELCGPLVCVIDNKVHLFHHTVREFLDSSAQMNSTYNDLYKRSDTLLGRICAQYLFFTDVVDYFQNPYANIERLRIKPLDCLSENYPFLSYAWENWAVHLRQVDDEDDASIPHMLQLCSPNRLSTLVWLRRKWCERELKPEDLTPLIIASYLGLPVVTQSLLKSTTIDPNTRDGIFGRSALSWAAAGGFDAVVKAFIDTQKAAKRRSFVERLFSTGGIDLDSKSKPRQRGIDSGRPRTALAWAVRLGHERVVKQLLATNRVKVDDKMLWDATRGGHEGVVKMLLETDQIKIDAKDFFKRTALTWAVQCGHEGLTRYLIATGEFCIDTRDSAGRTALTYAARSGEDQLVEQLLATGKVDVDAKDNISRTPLSYAAEMGHDLCVGLLLAAGNPDVNARGERGETPLFHAVSQGRVRVVRLLLATGKVDMDTEDYMGRTPIDMGLIRGHEECVDLLEEAKAVPTDVAVTGFL